MSARKVLRGGSWSHYHEDCRSAYRDYLYSGVRYDIVGFRVCCLPQDPLLSPPMLDDKVLRGGSWGSVPRDCRSADRGRIQLDDRNNLVGFRVVSLPQPVYHITMENPNIKMITIPAGEFVMGSSGTNIPTSETPAHRVAVNEFMMSQTQITQAQWREVANWIERPGEKWGRQLNQIGRAHV